jgi:C4-type Zn-finger protein
MTLHTDTTARKRLVTYNKNNCPQCTAWLLAPDWSEYLNDRCVRHTWSCDECGYQFETAVFFSAPETQAAPKTQAA